MTRITRIDVTSAANVLAVISLLLTLVASLPFALSVIAFRAAGDVAKFAPAFLVVLVIAPALAALLAWVTTAIGVLVYNLVAGRFGGVGVHLESDPQQGGYGAPEAQETRRSDPG